MRALMLVFVLSFVLPVAAQIKAVPNRRLFDDRTTTGASATVLNAAKNLIFYASGTTTAGAGAATIPCEGNQVDSAVDADWVNLGTITLVLGTTSTGDGFSSPSAPWKFVRCRVSAISGTNANFDFYMCSDSGR
jgi:hypothetical protein